MRFNQVFNFHKISPTEKLYLTDFLREIKSSLCIAYFDTDGEYFQIWFKNNDELKYYMKMMRTNYNVIDYHVSKGIKRNEVILIGKSNLHEYFDNMFQPKSHHSLLVDWVLKNVSKNDVSLFQAKEEPLD